MMKITRKELANLIQEEIENLSYKIKKPNVDDILSYDYVADVKAQEDAWAGGANIVSNIEHLKAGGSPEKHVTGIERLKITEGNLTSLSRSQIREAIKAATKQTLLVEAKITDIPESTYPNIWKHIIVPLQAIITGEEHMGKPDWEAGHNNEQIKFEIPDAVWPKKDANEIFADQVSYPHGLELSMISGEPSNDYAKSRDVDVSKGVDRQVASKHSDAAEELKKLAMALVTNRQGSITVGITQDVGYEKAGEMDDVKGKSGVSEDSLVNESMMVSLKPIARINKEPESDEERWMRIAGLSEEFLLERSDMQNPDAVSDWNQLVDAIESDDGPGWSGLTMSKLQTAWEDADLGNQDSSDWNAMEAEIESTKKLNLAVKSKVETVFYKAMG